MTASDGTPAFTSAQGSVQTPEGLLPAMTAVLIASLYELLPARGPAIAVVGYAQFSGMLSGWPRPRKWPISCRAAASKS